MRSLLIVLLALLVAGQASAQPPAVYQPSDEVPPDKERAEHLPWAMDVLLGLPTGVRVQRVLTDKGGFLVEGFAGFNMIVFPTVGAGFRQRWTPVCTDKFAFSVSPGVDAYLITNILQNGGGFLGGGPDGYVLIAGDVDLTWCVRCGDGWGSEAGLKLGVGALSDREYDHWEGKRTTWRWFPVVSCTFGFSF